MAIRKVNSRSILDGTVATADLDDNPLTIDSLVVDTSTLVVDATNHNVGIGVTAPDSTPSTKLHIREDDAVDYKSRAVVQAQDQRLVAGSHYQFGVLAYSYLQATNDAETVPLNLSLNPDGGNVGIGTAVPTSRLHIGKAADTVETGMQFTNADGNGYVGMEGSSGNRFLGSSTNNMFVGTTGADGLEFATNNNVRMKIDSSGNVGIGVSSMTNKLVLPNAAYFAMQDTGGAESLAIRANSSNAMEFLTGGGVRATITSTGNVGIGTSSPAAKLQVAGTSGNIQARLGTSAAGYVEVNAYDASPVYCVVAGNNHTAGVFGTQSNTPTIFFTNNTERMRIDSSGNVGIGGTPTELLYLQANNPEFAMQAATDGGECAIYFKDDDGNKDGRITYRTDYAGQTDNYMQFFTNGAERFRINGNGSLTATASLTYPSGNGPAWGATYITGHSSSHFINFFTNATERMRIKADGTFNYNGLKIFAQSFYGSNNISYSFDIPVGDEGGGGQNMLVLATHAHYFNFAYGCGYYAILGRRTGQLQARILDSWSNANGGAWSISNPSNSTMRLTKSAGTYGGGGWGIVYVIYPHGT